MYIRMSVWEMLSLRNKGTLAVRLELREVENLYLLNIYICT